MKETWNMAEVESQEETVILTYCHHDDEEEGNEGSSSTSDEQSSSLKSPAQLLDKCEEGGDGQTTHILTWPSQEHEIESSAVLPPEEDVNAFSDCALSVAGNEGIEYCLSDIVEEAVSKDVSDPSCFKVQSPAKLFAAAFGKRIKKAPVQQKMLILNNQNSAINDGGTNSMDSADQNNIVVTLRCIESASQDPSQGFSVSARQPPSSPLDSFAEQQCVPYNPTLVSHGSAMIKENTSETTASPNTTLDEASDEPLRGILRNPTIISRSNSKVEEVIPSETQNAGYSSILRIPTIASHSSSKTSEITRSEPQNSGYSSILRNPTITSHSSSKTSEITPSEPQNSGYSIILRNPTITSSSSSKTSDITPSEPQNNACSSILNNPTLTSRSSSKTTEITHSENSGEPSSIVDNPAIIVRSNSSSKLDDSPLDDSWKPQNSINPMVRARHGRKMRVIPKKHENHILHDPWKPQIQYSKNTPRSGDTPNFIRPDDDPLLDDLWKPQNISHQKTFVEKVYRKGWLRKKRTVARGMDAVSERRSLDTIREEQLLEPSYLMAEAEDDTPINQLAPKENEEAESIVKEYPIMAIDHNTVAMNDKNDFKMTTDTSQKLPAGNGAVTFPSSISTSSELDILSRCFCGVNDYSTVAPTRVHSMGEIAAQGNRYVTPRDEDRVLLTAVSTPGSVNLYPASEPTETDNDRVERKLSDGVLEKSQKTFNVSSDTDGVLLSQEDEQENENLKQLDNSKDMMPTIPDFAKNVAKDTYNMTPNPVPAAGYKNKLPQNLSKKLLKFASNSKRSSEKSLWKKKSVPKEKKHDNDTIIPSNDTIIPNELAERILIYESPPLGPQGSEKQIKEVTQSKASRKKALPPYMSSKRVHLHSSNSGHSWDESTGISFFTVDTADTSFDTTLSTVSIEEEESDSSYGSVGESTHDSDFHKNDIAESQCDGAVPNLFSSILKQIDQIFDCAFDTTTKSSNEDRRSRKR